MAWLHKLHHPQYYLKTFLKWTLLGLLVGAVGGLLAEIPILGVGIPAIFSLYFDWFGSFIQAFIFCILTMIFISTAED